MVGKPVAVGPAATIAPTAGESMGTTMADTMAQSTTLPVMLSALEEAPVQVVGGVVAGGELEAEAGDV